MVICKKNRSIRYISIDRISTLVFIILKLYPNLMYKYVHYSKNNSLIVGSEVVLLL